MKEALRALIKVHALEQPDKEVCGLVFLKEGVYSIERCRNAALSPKDTFEIPSQSLYGALRDGFLAGYYHSHPRGDSTPSSADKAGSEQTELPCWIYSVPADTLECYVPCGHKTPLLGRTFQINVFDCLSLVKDYFSFVEQIEVEVPERTLAQVIEGIALRDIVSLYRSQGFFPVLDLKVGTVVCVDIAQSGKISHFGVIVEAGNPPVMLHQMHNRPSRKQVFGSFWAKRVLVKLRHRTMI